MEVDVELLKKVLIGKTYDTDPEEIVLELQSYGFSFDGDLMLAILELEDGCSFLNSLVYGTNCFDSALLDPEIMNRYIKTLYINYYTPLSIWLSRLLERRPMVVLEFYLKKIEEKASENKNFLHLYLDYDDTVISWATKYLKPLHSSYPEPPRSSSFPIYIDTQEAELLSSIYGVHSQMVKLKAVHYFHENSNNF